MNLGVVGLGKLGLPLAATLANYTNHEVMGYDINHSYLVSLQQKTFTTPEPDCDYSKVQIMPHLEPLIRQADMVFICVNTPSNFDGTMDLSQVETVSAAIAEILWKIDMESGPKRFYPLPMVMNSTVLPGTCRALNAMFPAINVISNPVWIAIGSVVDDLRNPPSMVIGADSPPGVADLVDIWNDAMWGNDPGIPDYQTLVRPVITDPTTSEFIKLAHNSICTIKMSYIGNIGDQARELGIDVHALTQFLERGGDRPGKFWKYGPPFGGQCFPRDLSFWNQVVSDPIGSQAEIINHYRMLNLVERVPPGNSVVILGKSYKYGVKVYEASASIALGHLLDQRGNPTVLVDEGDRIPADQDTYIIMHKEMAHYVPDGKHYINPWEKL